jgi:hypothetical protein
MPKLKVIKDFDWAHRHVDIKSYKKGDVIDTDDADLIRVAKQEKWVADAKKEDISAQLKSLEDEIAALGEKLANAEDSEIPALEAEIAQKQTELKALNS